MRINVIYNTRSRFDKVNGLVRPFTHTLPLKMANGKVRLIKGISKKHTCLSPRGKFGLIRAKIMDISGTPKHTKRNLRNKRVYG